MIMLLFGGLAFSQSKSIWKPINESQISVETKVRRNSTPRNYELFQLDLNSLKASLQGAPMRDSNVKSNVIIELPNAEGHLEHYRVVETPCMESALAAKYPMIKAYAAQGIEDPTAVVRFTVTQLGFHSMTLSGEKSAVFIEPYTENRAN